MNESMKEKIKSNIEQSITKFFINKDVKVTHILDLIFPVERRIRSLIGGLETSLGTTLWEPVAKALAVENGFEVLENKNFKMPVKLPDSITAVNSKWVTLREDRNTNATLNEFIEELIRVLQKEDIEPGSAPTKKITAGKGIDLWLKKEGVEYIFDIKTNQINQNGGLSLNRNLMDWYLYRLTLDPAVVLKARIAFPFNPYNKSFQDAQGSRIYPLQPGDDYVVENMFWDFLSGEENTWENIKKIFVALGEGKFGNQFNEVFYKNV